MPCRLPNPPLEKCNLHVTKASELLSRIFNMLHEILHLWIINYCLFPQSNLLVFMNLTCNIQLSNNFSFDSGMTCMHGFHGFKVCMLQNFFQDTWIECIYIYICICVWVCIKLQIGALCLKKTQCWGLVCYFGWLGFKLGYHDCIFWYCIISFADRTLFSAIFWKDI